MLLQLKPSEVTQLEQDKDMQRLMSVKEAAALTGLSPHTIYTMISQRRIPYVKVGRLVKFDQTMLDEWLKQHTVMPMPAKHG